MKKLLSFTGRVNFLIIIGAGIMSFLGCGHDSRNSNSLENSGFDKTQWDTGWKIVEETSPTAGGMADADPDTTKRHSSPRSCKLYGGSGHGEGYASASQEIEGIENPVCRAYYQYNIGASSPGGFAKVTISVIIDGEWKEMWKKEVTSSDDSVAVWTKWEEKCSGTVSAISFSAYGSGSGTGGSGGATFWIDDAYIGKE